MNGVIVVDDDEGIRRLLHRWLLSWGYDTRTAASADEALEEMTASPASIVFCDVMMPVHDGIWLAGQLRERWPDTAVIMATGVQDMETVVKMRRQGAVAYVSKPFGRESLRQALQCAAGAIKEAAGLPT
jgi:DNA-binding NtrC family response regulator